MTMRDWIAKLNDFLKLSGRELLSHAGAISAADARAKAEQEYAHYKKLSDTEPRRVDDHFDDAAKALKPRKNK